MTEKTEHIEERGNITTQQQDAKKRPGWSFSCQNKLRKIKIESTPDSILSTLYSQYFEEEGQDFKVILSYTPCWGGGRGPLASPREGKGQDLKRLELWI